MVEELLRRIVKKYAALKRRCEQKKCLLALSVAWALAGEAAGGNEAVFEHIDESIHARQSMDGQYLLPSTSLMGCYPIMVQGDPFVFDSEGTTMEMIMWDFYAVLIEHAWTPGTIGQFFYDVADEHQWKAYEVESQMLREKASSSDDARTSEASSVDVPSSELSSVDACSSEFLSDVSPFPESLAATPVFSSEPPAAFDSSPRLGSEASPFGSEPSDPLASFDSSPRLVSEASPLGSEPSEPLATFDSSPRLVSEASPLGSEPSEPLAVPNISERITLESWSETQEYLMEMRAELVKSIQNINQVIENMNHYIKNNTIMMNDNAQVNNQVSSDALGGIHIHFGGSFTNYGTLTGNVVNHNYPSGQQNPSQNEQQSQNASQSHNEPQNPSQNNQQTDYAGSSVSVPSSVSDASSTPAPSSASGASSTPAPSSVFDASSINSVLMSAKGRRILDALRDIHILDEHYAPVNLSWAEMGYLAYQIAFTLAIDNLWQVMGGFWGKNSNSLRSGYNRARQMPSISVFDDRIKEIFR